MPEGRQALDRARQLLRPAGHELKGEGGLPVDLRRGSCLLLGFRLDAEGDRLRIGPGEDTWAKLDRGLIEAYEDVAPPRTARAVVRGWIGALGPAFEDRVETANPERILGIAADRGFRELASTGDLARWCRGARRRWEVIREGAYRRRGIPMPEDVAAVAAPPATVGPGGRHAIGPRGRIAGPSPRRSGSQSTRPRT